MTLLIANITPWEDTWIQFLKMAPKTRRAEFSNFSFRSVPKLPREKRNECDMGVQYVISTLQAEVSCGSSYASTYKRGQTSVVAMTL